MRYACVHECVCLSQYKCDLVWYYDTRHHSGKLNAKGKEVQLDGSLGDVAHSPLFPVILWNNPACGVFVLSLSKVTTHHHQLTKQYNV